MGLLNYFFVEGIYIKANNILKQSHIPEKVLAGFGAVPAKASHDCGKHVHPQ